MSKSVDERRWFDVQCELRKSAEGRPILEGYAAVFDKRSQNLGGFVEEVTPSAFTKTLKDGADVRALLNHDPNFVLGRSTSKTLRLATDSTGLHYEVDLGEQSYARDLAITLERGDISQSSFGFRTVKDDWNPDADDPSLAVRSLLEVRLFDVSPVTYPAYLDATSGIGKRALDSFNESRGIEASSFVDALQILNGNVEPGAVVSTRFVRSMPLDARAALLSLTSR